MKFNLSKTRGHILGENSHMPRTSNIYMNEGCSICEKYLDDGVNVLRASEKSSMIICEECAYSIHSAYEANL